MTGGPRALDELNISLDPSSPLSLQHQLRRKVVDAIHSGVLRPGRRLPSSRALAERIGVSRNTVSLAYDALVAEGLTDYLARLMPLLAADARSGLPANDADLVARAWNLDALAGAYGEFVATYLPVLTEVRGDRLAEVADEDAFLLRTLLIHDYRRLLLRDPELPDVLLPVDWPGEKARRLCQELYRRLAPASERHLDKFLTLADGSNPACDPAYAARFSQEESQGNPLGGQTR